MVANTPDRIASRLRTLTEALYPFLARALFSVRFWCGFCLACGAVLAWSTRYSVLSDDGLSYLDIASEALRGGPSNLVNATWSPGYPALISVMLFLFHPTPGNEWALVHFVNFLVWIFVLWAFYFFLGNWLSLFFQAEVLQEKKRIAVPLAFSVFLGCTLGFNCMNNPTPDLCVAGFVLLAAALVCRFSLPAAAWKPYIALGAVLGGAYYQKTAMFPLGLALLAILFLLPPAGSAHRKKLACSACLFLAISAPLMVAISHRVGRLSLGETPRLNYAWYVNGVDVDTLSWFARDSDAHGKPKHAPRLLVDAPRFYEFGAPIKGTLPIWYDPSYWYAGLSPAFNLRDQLAALKAGLFQYAYIARQTQVFFFGAGALICLAFCERSTPTFSRRHLWLLAWPLTALAMYALVHIEYRYLTGFLVLFWLAVFGPLILPANRRATTAICSSVVCVTLISLLAHSGLASIRSARDLILGNEPGWQTLGKALGNLGLNDGDRLAYIYPKPGELYYDYLAGARYARLRVVAITDRADDYWRLSPSEVNSVSERLASSDIKALLARDRPAAATAGKWKDIPTSSGRYSVLLLAP